MKKLPRKLDKKTEVESKFVKTKAELARILEISRVTLDVWLKLPDRPRSTSNGKFVVAEWRVFAANRGRDKASEEMGQLKLQKMRDETARGQVELMQAAEELIPIEWARQLFAHLAISIRNIVMESGLVESEKMMLIGKIERINADDYLSRVRSQTVDAMAEESELGLQNGTGKGSAST